MGIVDVDQHHPQARPSEQWRPAPPASDVLDAEVRFGTILPADSQERKGIPLVSGLLDYFPAALAEIARVSKAGNDKHNPGQPLHWSRGKSADHADTIMRHLIDRGTIDPEDGLRHTAKVAWRALALLQEELEAEGASPGRGSRFERPKPSTLQKAIRGLDTEEGIRREKLAAERRMLRVNTCDPSRT
jgi:hypothetical protein